MKHAGFHGGQYQSNVTRQKKGKINTREAAREKGKTGKTRDSRKTIQSDLTKMVGKMGCGGLRKGACGPPLQDHGQKTREGGYTQLEHKGNLNLDCGDDTNFPLSFFPQNPHFWLDRIGRWTPKEGWGARGSYRQDEGERSSRSDWLTAPATDDFSFLCSGAASQHTCPVLRGAPTTMYTALDIKVPYKSACTGLDWTATGGSHVY